MKITKQLIKAADEVILDEQSVVEARSYGGAYDIEDDMFFSREDLDDLVEDVVDKLNDDPRYPGGFRYVDAYFSSPQHVVVKVSGQDGEDFQSDAYIDMRRIRKPSDLRKYADDIILNMERDMYDIYGSEELSEDLNELDQEFDSARTSINSNKVPAIFNLVKNWQPGTINLDYGGGKFDSATEYLGQKDVTNLVYDKFNRSSEWNRAIVKDIRANGGADTATCSNVLNVIKEPEVRKNVLENIKSLVKPDGTVYITVFEGSGKGDEGPTKSGYQLNRKTDNYLDEIREVFPDATRKGKLITAHNGAAKVTSATSAVPAPDVKKVAKAAADVQTAGDLNKVISSLLSINKSMYQHYSEEARSGNYSPAALGKMISDELWYMGEDMISASTKINASESFDNVGADVQKAVRDFMVSSAGFPDDEVDDYYVVETGDTEYGFKVEVRAELSYSSMENLIDILNSIVEEYDKDAYFENVDSGIIEAYINPDEIYSSEAIMAYDIDDARDRWLDPDYDDYDPRYENPMSGQVELAEVSIINCPVTISDRGDSYDVKSWKSWAKIEPLDTEYGLRLSDMSLIDDAMDIILESVQDSAAPGNYLISGSAVLVYDFTDLYEVNYDDYKYDTDTADLTLNYEDSSVSDVELTQI